VGKVLIDANITIAYKCSFCGSYKFFNTTPFTLLYDNKYSGTCRCDKSRIYIARDGIEGYSITVPCINCGNSHVLYLNKRNLLFKDLNVFYCPETGMHQCFIGKDELVRKKIDSLEKELDEIIDAFGYDDYFVNTRVMLDSLNRIHDIAEQGSLYCECGNNDIELALLSDKIYLKCKRCSGSKVIYAASNKDLKDILTKQYIILMSDSQTCNTVVARNNLYSKRLGSKSVRI